LIQIRVGVCAVIWTMWNIRNDFIFNKPKKSSFLQVIPMVIYWILYVVLSPTRGGAGGDGF
jgi:hypothetical protein